MIRQLPTSAKLVPILFLLFCISTTAQDKDKQRDFDQPDEEEELNRELWEFVYKTPYAEILPYVNAAQRQSRSQQVAEVELPNGWRINPAGMQVAVGRLPYHAVFYAGRLVVLNTGYYFNEPQEVSIVGTNSGQVIRTLRIKSLFPSAEVGLDGDLYISGGFDQKIYRLDRRFNIVREYEVGGFCGGLAAIDANHLAVGYMAIKNDKEEYRNGELTILNTATGKVEKKTDLGFFPYAVRYLNGRLYVTLLGEDKLLILSRQLRLLKTLAVGRTPQEMCTDGQRLYIVNGTSDNLSVLDLARSRIVPSINLAVAGSRFGRSPTSCALDGNRLFVTLADVNGVAIVDKRTGKDLGLIPTGWYPTKLLLNSSHLFVLNAKGIRARRPNPQGPQPTGPSRAREYVLTLLKGTVSIIPRSDIASNLSAWTRQVQAGSPMFSANEGFKLPIRHVFYVIKENRTYDQVLGDLGRGNGDPKLTLFGKDISPVHHQLANEFVTLDNFFVNGEISVLGHSFTSSGYASPFLEWLGNLSYSYRWHSKRSGAVDSIPAASSPAHIWDALDEKNVDYRIYGESLFLFNRAYRIISGTFGAESGIARKFYEKVVKQSTGTDRAISFYDHASPFYGQASTREDAYKLLGNPKFAQGLSEILIDDDSLTLGLQKDESLRRKFADLLYHFPSNFRSWDLKTSDLDRFAAWKTDFDAQLKQGRVAQFHYIWLPNDHTDGANDKIRNPFQFMAQNDAALGRLVEAISHSSIWKESVILVVEDDAQNGADHVDATRTIAFAAGPYVKRGFVVSDRYDQISMLRTIELLLGLEPLHLGDRLAVPMFGIFTDKPNFDPFVPVNPSERLSDEDRLRYQQLAPKGQS